MNKIILISILILIISSALQAQTPDPSKIEGYYYSSVGHNEMIYDIKKDGSGLLSITDKRGWKKLGTVPVKFTKIGNKLFIELNGDGETMELVQSNRLPSFYESGNLTIAKMHEDIKIAEKKMQMLRDLYTTSNGL